MTGDVAGRRRRGSVIGRDAEPRQVPVEDLRGDRRGGRMLHACHIIFQQSGLQDGENVTSYVTASGVLARPEPVVT
jgi:hypothetical protein